MTTHLFKPVRAFAHFSADYLGTTNLAEVRVHDLKHTLGRRLRAAGVGFDTRQVLLGHANGSVTTHYSAAELRELLSAAELVCFGDMDAPTLTLIVSNAKSRKSHAGKLKGAA